MSAPNYPKTSRLLSSFPQKVQESIHAYSEAAGVSPQTVIEYAIIHFLDIEEQLPVDYRQHYGESKTALGGLPVFLRDHIEAYAQRDPDMPPEFVVELALVFLHDPDAATFEEWYPGVLREGVERLQAYRNRQPVAAA
ncbi:MAG: hypothetical protein AAFY26_26285 [Cyanobacteria bacterium J06638_22]